MGNLTPALLDMAVIASVWLIGYIVLTALCGRDEGPTKRHDTPLSTDEWYSQVVAECKRRRYPEWFYCDREAWLIHYVDGDSPLEAIRVNIDAAQ